MTDIPRKLDVDTALTSFAALRCHLDIFVDGERQARVLSYDMDAGIVTKIATGPDGIMLVDFDKGEAKTETVRGKVAVQLREQVHATH